MHCYKCGKDNDYQAVFCTECGRQLKAGTYDDSDLNKKYFTQSIILILTIVVVIIFSSQIVTTLPMLIHDCIFQGFLFIILLVFLTFEWDSFKPLLKFKFKITPVLHILILAPALAVCVIWLSDTIQKHFDIVTLSYIDQYRAETKHVYTIGLLFVSIIPGLLEEALFRGILFNYLLRFTRPKNVILITGILFSFVHFSFLSVLWLLPIGIVLGYFRYRYRSLWYAVAFHMLYNASVFMLEPFLQ